MELKSKELTLLEDALNALIESHQRVIGEIKNSDETFYENKLFLNKFRVKPLTVEDLKQLDIEKELKRIKEVMELKEKLFLSNNYLLVVSNRIRLNISDKTH